MSKNERDYSAYIAMMSNSAQNYALFGGFVFASITILLTLLPDPSALQSQITLFFLTLLFHMLLTVLMGHTYCLANCIRIAPPSPPHARTLERLEPIIWNMLGIAVVLLYLLWNLIYLASAAAIAYGLFVIFQHFRLIRPVDKIIRETLIRK